jgi:TPR repeat protein
MNLFGIGIKANLDKGIKLLRESHEGGSPIGSFTLGIAYSKGIKVKADGARSIELMQSAADKGYSQAQFYLGLQYSQGRIVKKDIDKAISLLEASSAQGFSEAEQMLYHLLRKRKQEKRKQVVAKKKTIVAVDQSVVSEPKVTENKPKVVEKKAKPVVVSKDDDEPVTLKKKEVVKDVKPVEVTKVKSEPKRKWGLFSRKPKVEAKAKPVVKAKKEVVADDDLFVDFSTSLKSKAAQNDTDAMVSLATRYSVVEQDHEKAAEWYIKAAKLNDAAAQRYTGMIYFMGKGVKKDYEKAVMWLEKAKANGDRDAGKKLKLLEKIIGK